MKYVAGFVFNEAKNRVALIRKNKPEWQKGLLNGIGGKIENGESSIEAMEREFTEETGWAIKGWKHYALLCGSGFSVDFFCITADCLELLKSPEEEKVELLMLSDIDVLRGDMIENLPWLISSAIDHLNDGRPSFITAEYP